MDLVAIDQALRYDPVTGLFTFKRNRKKFKAGDVLSTRNGKGYFQCWIKGRVYTAHRMAWALYHNQDPGALQIDHINMIRTDNRIVNLRLANSSLNNHNIKVSGVSGVKGVFRIRNSSKWKAMIRKDGQLHYLGCFASIDEAQRAYATAAQTLYYSQCTFPANTTGPPHHLGDGYGRRSSPSGSATR